MDPISHLIIGAGVAAFSGEPLSLHNPLYLGAMIGATAPDLDIILQLKGELFYLKHHRGFSHSLLGLAVLSLIIGSILSLIFPGRSVGSLILWSFAGAFSHTLFDFLNSYGAQVLSPWVERRLTLNLVSLVDPFLLLVFGAAIFPIETFRPNPLVFAGLLTGYLTFRVWMRENLHRRVLSNCPKEEVIRLILLPSTFGIFKWDYVLETPLGNTVGQAHLLRSGVTVRRTLVKAPPNPAIKAALKCMVGKIFQEFTPYFHIHYYTEGGKQIVRFLDLRYFVKREFLHSATVTVDNRDQPIEGVFHPYHHKRNIRVSV